MIPIVVPWINNFSNLEIISQLIWASIGKRNEFLAVKNGLLNTVKAIPKCELLPS